MALCSERHGIDGDMVLRVKGNGDNGVSFLSSFWWAVKATLLFFWLVCSASRAQWCKELGTPSTSTWHGSKRLLERNKPLTVT